MKMNMKEWVAETIRDKKKRKQLRSSLFREFRLPDTRWTKWCVTDICRRYVWRRSQNGFQRELHSV